ncbi:hypothetical protein [Halalkalibacter alkalisediminis]|uniref:Uncharacterized protein n=1 Tax=Halalkalibacter alkalisediminis TaxID=935616 RepID=A0ABV6N9Z8_9BACI|nr:hypothetical protein [Halalkalibacter alkalisediminis]
MKNKTQVSLVILACIAILALGAFRIFQIERNYQANLLLATACIENEGTVVSTQNGFFALSKVTCEE